MLNFVEIMVVLLLAFVALPRMLLRGGQRLIHRGRRRDKTRRFTMAQYQEVMNRAGWRCEHHGLLTGRCEMTTGLEADHVHPWARGGATTIQNAQALCAAHNQAKRANVPFWWNLAALQRRRAEYFRPFDDPRVVRYGSFFTRRARKRRKRRRRRRLL